MEGFKEEQKFIFDWLNNVENETDTDEKDHAYSERELVEMLHDYKKSIDSQLLKSLQEIVKAATTKHKVLGVVFPIDEKIITNAIKLIEKITS